MRCTEDENGRWDETEIVREGVKWVPRLNDINDEFIRLGLR